MRILDSVVERSLEKISVLFKVRFFQVWSPGGSPRPADHSAYFGLAHFIVPWRLQRRLANRVKTRL
jgi:hypothetical protein